MKYELKFLHFPSSIQENVFENEAAKGRPFCPGLNELYAAL